MSSSALPLLFINLGGEMVYILHQRLSAQNIDESKSQKVLNDIIGTMYNKRFMDEVFKPQELHSKKAMRTVFDRLAHASIMRLNSASMDKLYDLMTMAVKYQVCLISRPRDLLLITLNHIDGLRGMVVNQPAVISTLDHLYDCVVETYARMTDGELQLIRQSLLSFFQDMNVRVSIFLKEKQQNQNGRFVLRTGGPVPVGTKVPGTIVLYDESGKVRQSKKFKTGVDYADSLPEGSIERQGDRVTKLGVNMYTTSKPDVSMVSSAAANVKRTTTRPENITPDPSAKAQLDLLSKLIGSSARQNNDFKLTLFNTDEEEDNYVSQVSQIDEDTEVLNIDARSRNKDDHLSKVMNEMSVASSNHNQDDDLLNLMDQA